MKALFIDHNYYKFPEGIESVEQFAKHLNKNFNSFIKLTEYRDENCREPYFITEETEEKFMNVSTINFFCERDITILTKAEYDEKLKKLIDQKCIHCVNYEDDKEDDEYKLENFRNHLDLNGYCWRFEKKSE